MRNNPVQIALDEAVNIWDLDHANPDIILSLGTGIEVDVSGGFRERKSKKLEALKAALPGGWRKLVDTGLDMVASTLDCQKEWTNFTRAHHDQNKCHRLNVGLEEPPPKLDDVGSLKKLQNISQKYVRQSARQKYPFAQGYANAHGHIESVARRLVASLFYFSEEIDGSENANRSIIGCIHCRLPPDTKATVTELAAVVRFRLVERKILGATNDVHTEIRRNGEFSRETMAIPVIFELMAGSWKRSIEVRVGPSEIWTGISGF